MKRYWQKLVKELKKRKLVEPAVVLSLTILLVCTCEALLIPRQFCITRGSPDPVSFEAVCGFTYDEFAALDEAALVRLIEQTHRIPRSEYRKTAGQGVVHYDWSYDGNEYRATLIDKYVQTITIECEQAGPSFCQVVDRLGPPATIVTFWYSGITGGNWYSIELEYPKQRLSFASSDFSDWYRATGKITRPTRVSTVYCYAPTSQGIDPFEEQYSDPCESSPNTYTVRRRLPWPGFEATVLFGCER